MTDLRFVLVVAMAVGCSSGSGSSSPAKDCTSGATQACKCSDGRDGSQLCSPDGFWKACVCGTCAVTPSCSGKACGADDGCGTACLVGSCPTDQKCNAGVCKAGSCVPDCSGKACGDPDLCGSVCTSGTCAKPGFACNAGKCECKPVCVKCGDPDTCGGKCTTGACDAGYSCSQPGCIGACCVDDKSKWVITVTKGSVPVDKGWNSFSLPDPMVCLWIGGGRVCTQEALNSLSPTWGCAFPPIAAGTLLTGIDVETWDNDRSGGGACAETLATAPGDVMCKRSTVTLAASDFKSRTWGAGCTDMSFSATLTPL